MQRSVLGAVLLVVATACTSAPGLTTDRADSRRDATVIASPAAGSDVDAAACRWGLGDEVTLPEQLSEDGLALAGKPPVGLTEATDWSNPPYDHDTWIFEVHTLRWTYHLVAAAADGDEAARRTVDEIYRSWSEANADPGTAAAEHAWDGHPAALRTQVATCAAHVLGLESAREILVGGVAWLRQEENFDGIWNHGVDQSISLLIAGCTLGDDSAVDLAVDRLDEHRIVGIDDHGVANEQATGYQQYIRTQYATIAEVMDACDLDGSRFRETRTAMLPMLVHATRPDGTMAPIGDTSPQSIGKAPDRHPDTLDGTRGPPETSVTYTRGYAFGRDGWGEDAAWFALRFGEGRVIHGHRDHASLLYDVGGVPVLTEAGFSGYQPGPWRDWERSHEAHNVVAVEGGGRFLWDQETPLVNEVIEDDRVSLTVAGRPYTAIEEHRRAVLVSFAPHAVVVHDAVTAPAPVETQQLWHLPPGWQVPDVGATETLATGPDSVDVRVLQFATATPPAVVEGQEAPIQGFVATGNDERTPAPVLAYEAAGTRIEYLTVIVPVGEDLPAVTVSRDGDVIHLASEQQRLAVELTDDNLVARS